MKQGPTFWETFCIKVARVVVRELPGVARNGFDQFGLEIPAFPAIDLPRLDNRDTGQPLTGFCGLDTVDVGTGILSIWDLVLSGLDTVKMTDGEGPVFTRRDEAMDVPITLGLPRVDGRWKIDRLCRNDRDGTYTSTAFGTFNCRFENATSRLSVTGLDKYQGAAGNVALDWVDPAVPPEVLLEYTIDPETPDSARDIVDLYLIVADNEINLQITNALTQVLRGTIDIEGDSLPGWILKFINSAFDWADN